MTTLNMNNPAVRQEVAQIGTAGVANKVAAADANTALQLKLRNPSNLAAAGSTAAVGGTPSAAQYRALNPTNASATAAYQQSQLFARNPSNLAAAGSTAAVGQTPAQSLAINAAQNSYANAMAGLNAQQAATLQAQQAAMRAQLAAQGITDGGVIDSAMMEIANNLSNTFGQQQTAAKTEEDKELEAAGAQLESEQATTANIGQQVAGTLANTTLRAQNAQALATLNEGLNEKSTGFQDELTQTNTYYQALGASGKTIDQLSAADQQAIATSPYAKAAFEGGQGGQTLSEVTASNQRLADTWSSGLTGLSGEVNTPAYQKDLSAFAAQWGVSPSAVQSAIDNGGGNTQNSQTAQLAQSPTPVSGSKATDFSTATNGSPATVSANMTGYSGVSIPKGNYTVEVVTAQNPADNITYTTTQLVDADGTSYKVSAAPSMSGQNVQTVNSTAGLNGLTAGNVVNLKNTHGTSTPITTTDGSVVDIPDGAYTVVDVPNTKWNSYDRKTENAIETVLKDQYGNIYNISSRWA